LQIKTKKSVVIQLIPTVKQEVNRTVILPYLVFPAYAYGVSGVCLWIGKGLGRREIRKGKEFPGQGLEWILEQK
jgi:hypothetical protein